MKSEVELLDKLPDAAANSPTSSRGSAYGVLVLLTLINVLNIVDRQLLPSFANFIKPDLGLTDTQYGLLTGLFFIVFYATAGLFTGVLADLVHRPRLIAAAITLWSVLTAASGAAKSFVTMAIPRALVGVGESALTPTAMSLLADRFKPSQLGFAAGFYYLGVPVGAGVSYLVVGYLGQSLGWRNCFYLLGISGVVLALVALRIKEPRQQRVTHEKGLGFGAQMVLLMRALRQSPALAAAMIGGVVLQIPVGAAAFDQLWYVQERGFDRVEIARIVGFVTLAGGIVGNLAGGILGDWWQRRGKTGRPMMLFWMFLLVGPFTLAHRIVSPENPLFWIGLAVAVLLYTAFYGPIFATVQELSPAKARGTVTAFFIFGLNVIGIGIGTTFAGWTIDAFRTAGVVEPYTWTGLVFGTFGLLALPAFFYAGKRFNEDRKRLAAG
jgi:MFS family permease